MVFLIISRDGYQRYQTMSHEASYPIWLAKGVLTESELLALHNEGSNVSHFHYVITAGDYDSLADAVETIREHHPNERIWAEV